MKIIKIPTTNLKFYRQVLELLRSIPPINKLRPKELDVLAQLMHYNNVYRNLDEFARASLLLSKQQRKLMRETLEIGEDSFNNHISRLRKFNIVKDNGGLHPFFDTIEYDKNFELRFNLKSKDD